MKKTHSLEKTSIGSFYTNPKAKTLLVEVGELAIPGFIVPQSDEFDDEYSKYNFLDNVIKIAYLKQQTDILQVLVNSTVHIRYIELDIDVEKYKKKQREIFISLNVSNDYRLIIDYVFSFATSGDNFYLHFKSIDETYTCNTSNENFIYWVYILYKAFISEQEVEVIIDIRTNEILDIKYPVETTDIENHEIKAKLIPKIIKKTSTIQLPNYNLMQEIEETNLEHFTVAYFVFKDTIKYYFTDTPDWMMRFWQTRFSRKDGNNALHFPEERVMNFFKEAEVKAEDLRQTMRYLIDIEAWEKVKSFLPSFYFHYPNKQFISFFRANDSFVQSILPDWTGKHESFFDLIPEPHRYWVIDGKDWSKE